MYTAAMASRAENSCAGSSGTNASRTMLAIDIRLRRYVEPATATKLEVIETM